MKIDSKLFQSPTFCTLPWIHLASTPNGRAKICCMAEDHLKNENGELFNFTKDSIESMWNSPQLKDVRKKMLNGEKVSACNSCYREEALGGHSMRIGFNEKWLDQELESLQNRIAETEANGYVLNQQPWYYDLRQGNLCNLKCRSCSPENSISIEKESHILAQKSEWYKKNVNSGLPTEEGYKNWFNSDFFNNQLSTQLPNIKKIYFTGGEPTLIDKNFELMRQCVSTGESKHIELMFNTNMTNITDEFLTLLSKFKFVTLNLSIEGIGPIQEYLRGNSDWLKIEKNLIQLAKNKKKNFSYLITPVIQNTNVMYFVDMLKYFQKMNLQYGNDTFLFMPIILNSPKHLDINILPTAVKLKSKELLQQFIDHSSDFLSHDRFLPVRLEQILIKLDEPQPDNTKQLTQHFIKYTQLLDQQRNQDFEIVFPELFELWSKHSDFFTWELYKMNIAKNDSICSLPFVHMNSTTGGLYRYCCIMNSPAKDSAGKPLTLHNHNLSDAWNSDEIKNIRRDMIQGKKNSLCSKCHYDESHGNSSLRKDYLKTWIDENPKLLQENILAALINDGQIDSPPSFIELKFSNFCNLKCRMCSPHDSSLIAEEYDQLAGDNPDFAKLWSHRQKVLFNNDVLIKDNPNWVEIPEKWDQFVKLIPNLKKIHFAGGEPTLHKYFYQFLEKCVHDNYSKNIELSFNTNLTVLPEKLLKIISEFKTISIHVSIEGIGATQEYIRYPSNWEKIQLNLLKLVSLPDQVNVYISPTLQIYNIEKILDLFNYIDALNKISSKFLIITPNLLDNPEYLNLRLLPIEYRLSVAKKWSDYKKTIDPVKNWWIQKIDSLISVISEESNTDSKIKLLPQFVKFTKILDASRNQKFETVFPELHLIIENFLATKETTRQDIHGK